MGAVAVTAAYQTWGMYKILHPSSNFKGGLERLEAEAATKHPVTDSNTSALPPGELHVPDGLFRVRLTLPYQELLTYVQSTHSDVLYINFHDFPMNKESLYRYLVDRAAIPLDKADITDEKGEENVGSLMKYLSMKMVEKMTEHRTSHLKSAFSPQAWLLFWFKRFYSSETLQSFYTARFPVVVVEGCELWQEVLEGDTANSAEKEEKLEVILNFLKWLYVLRYHLHVVMVTKKPIDQVLFGFSKWYGEEVEQPEKPIHPPELIVRS